MSHYSIKVFWSQQDGMFVAVCPALGDISALASTAREAVAELEQAIELALETYSAQGWPLPEPDVLEEYSGQFRLRLPRAMHAWLAHEAERQGVSLNTLATSLLAEAMGVTRSRTSFAKEIGVALDSMRKIASEMQNTMTEIVADSSTSEREAQPAEYRYRTSSSGTLKIVKKAV